MISCPAFVCFRLICRRRASAGGQLEHPSDVNSSTIATDDGVALIELSGEAACDSRGTARRASEIANMGRNCIGIPPAKRLTSDLCPRETVTPPASRMSCNQNVPCVSNEQNDVLATRKRGIHVT